MRRFKANLLLSTSALCPLEGFFCSMVMSALIYVIYEYYLIGRITYAEKEFLYA